MKEMKSVSLPWQECINVEGECAICEGNNHLSDNQIKIPKGSVFRKEKVWI